MNVAFYILLLVFYETRVDVDFITRGGKYYEPVHVINIETEDKADIADEASKSVLWLVEEIAKYGNQWEERLMDILSKFRDRFGDKVMYTVSYY